jgi:hypothetical protein
MSLKNVQEEGRFHAATLPQHFHEEMQRENILIKDYVMRNINRPVGISRHLNPL